MMKLGVYMGPTGNLFVLDTLEELLPEYKQDSNNGETHALCCIEDYALPGEMPEFKLLLAGFTYLGPV